MPRIVLLALLALLFTAPAAQACTDQPLSRPFTPWLDFAYYEPAPDAGLESGAAGWTLDGATVVDGGYASARSLALPTGASAVTPPVCVTPAHPTLRFFTRGPGVLAVSVVVDGLELPIGAALPGARWAPSPILPLVVNLLGDRDVRFRFASTLGTVRVDDVWIDPYSKG
ncbi:MAG TPA: hypothetical protein VFG79_07055 [Solirubrobacter sp.]|nr:hypothetical protein [Solirubrobacter sp.]